MLGKSISVTRPARLLQAPQKSITSSAPIELVGLDFLLLDTSVDELQYLLAITDHFTRYDQVSQPITKKQKLQERS